MYLQKLQSGTDPVVALNDIWNNTDLLQDAEEVKVAKQWLPIHIAFDKDQKQFRRREDDDEVRVPTEEEGSFPFWENP